MLRTPASIYANRDRKLCKLLELEADALPGGGNFYPEEDVLVLLAEQVLARRPAQALSLGGGVATAVIARAQHLSGGGALWILEDDARRIELIREMLATIGASATIIEAGLEEYDDHNLWYPRHRMGRVPNQIDLLFIDGPGHFAGRMPRWPAGPELFPRLTPDAVVILDDGKRVKEKKALERWAQDFPDLKQEKTKTSGGAIRLRRS